MAVRKANRLESTQEEYNMAERQDQGRSQVDYGFSGYHGTALGKFTLSLLLGNWDV